jgi:hypothetical protein
MRQVQVVLYKYFRRMEIVLENTEWEESLTGQLEMVLALLTLTRVATLDVFDIGKAAKKSSSSIFKQLKFIHTLEEKLTSIMEDLFYSYGLRRPSMIASDTVSNQLGGTLSRRRSAIISPTSVNYAHEAATLRARSSSTLLPSSRRSAMDEFKVDRTPPRNAKQATQSKASKQRTSVASLFPSLAGTPDENTDCNTLLGQDNASSTSNTPQKAHASKSRNAAFESAMQSVSSVLLSPNGPLSPLKSPEAHTTEAAAVVPQPPLLELADSKKSLHLRQPSEGRQCFAAAMSISTLIEAPLLLLQDRLSLTSPMKQKVLMTMYPDLSNLTKQVQSFRTQGYNELLMLMYVAETVGKTLVGIARHTELRRHFYPVLQLVFNAAHANVQAALALMQEINMQQVIDPCDYDLASMFTVID